MLFKVGSQLQIVNPLNKTASQIKEADTSFVTPKDDNFTYFQCIAVHADVPNMNADIFPLDELKSAYKSFIGRGLYMDHNASSVANAIGKIFDAKLIQLPNASEEEGKYGVLCLCGVDKTVHPDIAKKVAHGVLDSVSMGANVNEAECLWPYAKVFTPDGPIRIADIKVGDYVLTHKGQFKKVTRTIINETPSEMIRISFSDGCSQGRLKNKRGRNPGNYLDLSSEHPVLLSTGEWVRAADVKVGDKVKCLSKRCLHCGKPILYSYNRNFCSKHCKSVYVNSQEEVIKKRVESYKDTLVNYTPEQRAYISSIRSSAQKKHMDSLTKEQKEELSAKISDSLQEFFKSDRSTHERKRRAKFAHNLWQNPEFAKKFSEILNNTRKNAAHSKHSYIEDLFDKELKKRGYTGYNTNEYMFKEGMRMFPDFVFYDKKIVVECDGEYWHNLPGVKEKDNKKTAILERDGFTVLRFTGAQIVKDVASCVDTFERVYNNHSGNYEFFDYDVIDIEIKPTTKKCNKVYNISVADDESYVAENLVVHNCGICHKVARTPEEFCVHLQHQGQIDPETGKRCCSINRGVNFTELSLVGVPADPYAKMQQVFADFVGGLKKQAEIPEKKWAEKFSFSIPCGNEKICEMLYNLLSSYNKQGIMDLSKDGSILKLNVEAGSKEEALQKLEYISEEQGLDVEKPLKKEDKSMSKEIKPIEEEVEVKEEVKATASLKRKADVDYDPNSFDSIYSNYVNGNLTEFKESVNKLVQEGPVKIMEFLDFLENDMGLTSEQAKAVMLGKAMPEKKSEEQSDIGKKADFDEEDSEPLYTKLEMAIAGTDLDEVKKLLNTGKYDVNRENSLGETPLYLAQNKLITNSGDKDTNKGIIKLLLAHGAKLGSKKLEGVDSAVRNMPSLTEEEKEEAEKPLTTEEILEDFDDKGLNKNESNQGDIMVEAKPEVKEDMKLDLGKDKMELTDKVEEKGAKPFPAKPEAPKASEAPKADPFGAKPEDKKEEGKGGIEEAKKLLNDMIKQEEAEGEPNEAEILKKVLDLISDKKEEKKEAPKAKAEDKAEDKKDDKKEPAKEDKKDEKADKKEVKEEVKEEKIVKEESCNKEAKPEFTMEEEKGKDGKEYETIKGPEHTYKDEEGKDYHFDSKEKAEKEEGFLEAEHKYDDKKDGHFTLAKVNNISLVKKANLEDSKWVFQFDGQENVLTLPLKKLQAEYKGNLENLTTKAFFDSMVKTIKADGFQGATAKNIIANFNEKVKVEQNDKGSSISKATVKAKNETDADKHSKVTNANGFSQNLTDDGKAQKQDKVNTKEDAAAVETASKKAPAETDIKVSAAYAKKLNDLQAALVAKEQELAQIKLQATLEKKTAKCRKIVEMAIRSGHVKCNEQFRQEELLKQASPVKAQEEAMKRTAESMVSDLLALSDEELKKQESYLSNFKVEAEVNHPKPFKLEASLDNKSQDEKLIEALCAAME